jgi:hypothetical protein
MRRHGLDLFADLSDDTSGSRIRRVPYADRVHQLLDRGPITKSKSTAPWI